MAAPVGERRVVSVLLADIADSTAIGERLGPERSKFLFDEVTRLLAREVKRFGGTVAQLTGDGLYALFGVPHAHDDDAERAVRAALAMQIALAGYAKDVEAGYGVELAGRIGVNTGPVVLLPNDAPAEERFNALGDTVNTAARLQSEAGLGGVAVGQSTARQIEGAFELEAVGPRALKGKASAVDVFRVAGEREVESRRLSPLVGRDAELAALDEVFDDLEAGRGAIVALTGEPGIGKSRLVAEVRDRHQEHVRFFATQGISYAQNVPYYPLREFIRTFVGLGVSDPEAQVRLELKTHLAAVLADRADAYYPFLASLLGLALEDDAAEQLRGLASDSAQRQSHEAVVEFVRAFAHAQPVGLVLEDLHFADDPSLELFAELLQLADAEAVAVLLVYRNDPDLPSWGLGEAARRRYRHRFRELQLDPLLPEEGALLAASAAGRDLPTEAAVRLAERTGGNPLFLEEAARDAVEGGDSAAVPDAIQETLQARLDRLSPEVREVVSVASVVGRSFGMPLLERLVPPEQLRPALSELQRLDLVVEERGRPTPEYRFRHGLVQEAAYTSLLEPRRRELHRVVGTTLEELDPSELSEAYGLLARHFDAADEPTRAAHYLLEAGNAARALYADKEAIANYRRALSFLDRLGDTKRARSVLFEIALANHLAFDFEAADAAWAEAFARPEPPVLQLEPTERLETCALPDGGWIPGIGYDSFSESVGSNLFRGLLRFERGMNIVPDLADRVSVSADGRTYTFRLREGLRWSDGEPLTASDFAFTYRAMREQAVQTVHLLEDLDAHVTDDRTLELRLPEPRPHMLHLFASFHLFAWPQHQGESLGPEWHTAADLVTSGPFMRAEVGEERVACVRNPMWNGSLGNVAELSIELLTRTAALEAWRAGALDFVLDEWQQLGELRETTVVPIPSTGCGYIAFPAHFPFDDVRVRKALAHALDRATLMPGIEGKPARGGFLGPGMPGHSHELALAHDIPLAQSLLAEAGFPGGSGLPELRLLEEPGTDARWDAQWKELGVRVRQEHVDEIAKLHSFWRSGWLPDYPDPDGMLRPFLETYPVPRDEELSALLEQARSVRSRDARLELYRRIDRRLVAECAWVVPTIYGASHLLHRPHVEGIWAHDKGIGVLDEVVVRRTP
jgi:ABC-type transport system substrate-binding protein/class 3 adenylate cyclase